MRVPKDIRVGSQTYKVAERLADDDGGLVDSYAYTLPDSNLIVLRKDAPIDRKRALLMHELLHAVIFTFGNHTTSDMEDYQGWEHHFIYTLQEPMVLVLRDNPELVAFLVGDA